MKLHTELSQPNIPPLAQVKHLISEIDRVISEQLSLVMAEQKFVDLEARWRNVYELVSLPVNYKLIKVKIMNISWREISHDLNIATSLRHTRLYNIVANQEFNTMGGEPYGLLVIDHNVSLELDYADEFDELYTLELLAELGEKSLCPIILDADDSFLGASGEMFLCDVPKLNRVLADSDFASWHRLRESSNSHFLGLTFNKSAIRKAYRFHPCGFIFDEDIAGDFVWGNAATTFLKNVLIEFNRVRWFGFLKSRKLDASGGSAINCYADKAQFDTQFKTRISASTAAYLSQQGLIPIFYNPLNGKYFFQSNSSVKTEMQGENRFLIQTTLMISRIAHYLKVQLREMIGSALEPHDCENRLSHWLEQYCSNSVVSDEMTLAGMPLKSAKVRVTEESSDTTRYTCHIDLVPQYQYDRVASMVSLSTAVEK
ncbi:type VI secretion system contractile sheath domain-containing protein [Pseudoalteromonas aurantia]|uniref:Type VI secretion system protein ImpD n=1 Tax=Pseudoalteromonas aurantia 208 TaxID=1314867 RepID=A0ABR9EF97_9GAMM|nr:type VI secretion system contractile sheath large subunit [Pseudoalteromonas aurantia]MBE0369642.1 type VI secretion system protein ImpD [Pseudoalteromonas aurantia 208]